jgi:hypothetical protein
MDVRLSTKFTDKNLDEVINNIYINLISNPKDNYLFDLTNVEYIGNQELLVLSALFRSFFESKIQFKVLFFHPGFLSSELEKRVKKQMIEIWDVWRIWQTVPANMCREIFGIDDKFINSLKAELGYYPKSYEIYKRNGVTPFVSLDFINNYSEKGIEQIINPIYRLESVIKELLEENNCYHPFVSNSLSTIITEELYLNFLDHSLESSIPNFPQMAFMSISLHRKFDEKKNTLNEIQSLQKLNFQTECLEESLNFFYDSEKKKYKNDSYIEFSFLDFGSGIANTLKEQFLMENNSAKIENLESDILRHSFSHNTSRHPIYHEKNEIDQFIPRGLFDVLTIVRRYKGVLIVRSNFGKILFDFSVDDDIDKAFSYFGNKEQFFPGTLISFYIPAIEDVSKLDSTSIKPPEAVFSKVKSTNKKYVNINTIVEKLNVPKEKLYPTLRQELRRQIYDPKNHSLVFISFKGCDIDRRIVKKTLYFLLTDYEINHRNNVVILNSPPKDIIDDIALNILRINAALRNYKLHPLPIIDFDENNRDLNVKWLGIYDDEDKEKLNDLLYDQHSLAISDFNDPANILGHLNSFDSFGNLISNFPNRAEIFKIYNLENDVTLTDESKQNPIEFYRTQDDTATSLQVENLLKTHGCIVEDDNKSLYLCKGNYYQKAYVELNNLVNDKTACNIISNLLFQKLKFEIGNLPNYRFIGITPTSEKILKSLESQGLISSNFISLDNYHSFEDELSEKKIEATEKFILICHVISSGFLAERLDRLLRERGTQINHIAVILSTLDTNFEKTKFFLRSFKGKIISLHEYPITKFKRNNLDKETLGRTIVRVNPNTGLPIRLSIDKTNFRESVIFHNEFDYSEEKNEIIVINKFLDCISEDSINIGFLKFNSAIHPYFFDTEKILKDMPFNFLKDIFDAIGKNELKTKKVQVFYPRKSGIDFFKFQQLKSVLTNENIEEIEIERFETTEGWKFPHNSDFLDDKIKDTFCLILDDGSCSGDSLIQMIDEIAFYNAKEIIVLCFIGRVKNHKRELFSRLTSIKTRHPRIIPLSIYFACHWHIPTYYLDENPNIRETAWLDDLIDLQNTPRSIKDIARNVKKVIEPKKKGQGFIDYKYLPKIKKTGEIPKKELLTVREEVGKVIGYRLYKESFTFFDLFMRKYSEIRKTEDRYKEIELLCAIFVYEPYLYDKLIGVVPDVVERIEEFVEVLLFNHLKIEPLLTYSWEKRNIIHLFFVVFRNKNLLEKLTKENFISLIQFTKPRETVLDYILYKLLQYFPISNIGINKHTSEIKKLLLDVSGSEKLSNTAKTKIRIYSWFISSLPSSGSFQDFQSKLKSNFDSIVDQKYHDDNIFSDKQIINSVLLDIGNKIRKKQTFDNEIISIKTHWENISAFIKDLLSFTSSFQKFFIDEKLFFELETKDNSLRKLYGDLTESIYNEDLASPEVGKKLNEIFSRFILDESQTLKIFSKPNTADALAIINKFVQAVKKKYPRSIFKIVSENNIALDFPQHFFETVLRELYTNFRHINLDEELRVYISITNDKLLKIKIWNFLNDEEFVRGGNNGMKILKNLKDNPYHKSYYKRYSRKLNHLQIIKFKIL